MMALFTVAAARWWLCLAALGGALAATNAYGKKFLSQNADKEGVITLPSGLQYRILRRGLGDAHPKFETSCACHYEGRTAQNYPDGPKFESSYDRGATDSFAPKDAIPGWKDAMMMMVEGDKWEFFIPAELGYGAGGAPPKIQPGDAVVITLEIVQIKGPNKTLISECDVGSLDGCTEQERGYLEEMRAKTEAERNDELERLQRTLVDTPEMKAEKAAWMLRRTILLRKMAAAASAKLKEEL